jgi:hypothetical protein
VDILLAMNALTGFIVACVVLWLAGCSISGPTSIRTSRTNYNDAIARTSAEQLLLNLVRLRYRDVPLFLEVSSVTTTFEVEVAGGMGIETTTPEIAGVDLDGRITLSERPSVTYLPLQGEMFVKKLMTPLETETLVLMYHSGWSLDRMLKVCVRRLGPLVNAARASGPTPAVVPTYQEFFEAADLLQRLWEQGDLELGLATSEKGPASLVIRFDDEARGSAEVSRLKQLLGLPASMELTGITASQTEITGEGVALVTRSLMACMYFLSQGVEPPERDVQAGRVTVTRDDSGAPFDWARITGGLMRIRSGDAKPEEVYASVEYRGTSFWIDDGDLDSKSTFALLGQLLELQSGSARGSGPVLTLPIGGG